MTERLDGGNRAVVVESGWLGLVIASPILRRLSREQIDALH
ncbi:hypothetical protein [Metallibacterium scheffleri]|jgi:hypothetical protein|nr:hypothetical protein [Metallibacterium scheffleri]